MRALFWLLVAVVGVVMALFAASNRAAVELSIWPLPFLVEAPLYLVVLVALLAGLVMGCVSAWVGAAPRRREARLRRRRIAALESELQATQTRLMPPPSVPDLRR